MAGKIVRQGFYLYHLNLLTRDGLAVSCGLGQFVEKGLGIYPPPYYFKISMPKKLGAYWAVACWTAQLASLPSQSALANYQHMISTISSNVPIPPGKAMNASACKHSWQAFNCVLVTTLTVSLALEGTIYLKAIKSVKKILEMFPHTFFSSGSVLRERLNL